MFVDRKARNLTQDLLHSAMLADWQQKPKRFCWHNLTANWNRPESETVAKSNRICAAQSESQRPRQQALPAKPKRRYNKRRHPGRNLWSPYLTLAFKLVVYSSGIFKSTKCTLPQFVFIAEVYRSLPNGHLNWLSSDFPSLFLSLSSDASYYISSLAKPELKGEVRRRVARRVGLASLAPS